jgi:VanZ family protein
LSDGGKFARYHLPPLVWATIIFIESSIPGHKFPTTPLGTDKLVHVAIFFILGWLSHRAFTHQSSELVSKMSLYLTLVVTILYGFSDEFHQLFVPGRTANMYDMAADALGGFLFIAVFLAVQLLRKNASQRTIS